MRKKTTLIRVNQETKDLLDSVKGSSKGYSDFIEHLIYIYKINARIHVVEKYLLDQYDSEIHLLDRLDDYMHRYCQDDDSWLINKVRNIIDEYELEHGNMSKTEIENLEHG